MVFVEFVRACDGKKEYCVGRDLPSVLKITANGTCYGRVSYVPNGHKTVPMATVEALELRLFKAEVKLVGEGKKPAEWLGMGR